MRKCPDEAVRVAAELGATRKTHEWQLSGHSAEGLISMNVSAREFVLDPAAYGLPTREELVKLRIWDIHYHGFLGGGMRQHEENLFYVERMGIERMLSLDIAGTTADPLGDSISQENKRTIREYL